MTTTTTPKTRDERTGHDVIEDALKVASQSDWLRSPAHLGPEAGRAYQQGLAAAYQHALEMIPATEAKTQDKPEKTEPASLDAGLPKGWSIRRDAPGRPSQPIVVQSPEGFMVALMDGSHHSVIKPEVVFFRLCEDLLAQNLKRSA